MKNNFKFQWVELWLRSASIIQAQLSYMNPALEVLYFDLNISPQGVTQTSQQKTSGRESNLMLNCTCSQKT